MTKTWAVAKCRKLRGKYFGSFPVVAVHSPLAIELRLPVWLHASVHPVFHPMYLKLSTTTTVDHGLRSRLQSIFEPADSELGRGTACSCSTLGHRLTLARAAMAV
jgi:hypothetical protein